MNKYMNKLAALLAFGIGLSAALAGGRVLMGKLPTWSVLSWLPLYNYTMGLVSVLVLAGLLWTGHRYALAASALTLAVHVSVLGILQTAFTGRVAAESIQAMVMRAAVWAVILSLLLIQRWRGKVANPAGAAEQA
jgi:hypothetical protein